MSTQYKPLPNGCTNANTQHLNGHPKPIIHLPRWHRPPLEGESVGGAANGCTHSSSGQPMPQKPAASPNELDTLVTTSIKLESPCSIEISHVCLGGMSWHADDPNGPGNQTDGSHGQVDKPVGYKHCCGMFTTLHKHKAHYSRVCSTLVPSVACQTTEGEYHSTNHLSPTNTL